MKTIALSDAKAKLSDVIDTVRRDRQDIVIERHKKGVVVLVEAERYERLRQVEDAVTRLELQKALRGKKYRLEDVLNELPK